MGLQAAAVSDTLPGDRAPSGRWVRGRVGMSTLVQKISLGARSGSIFAVTALLVLLVSTAGASASDPTKEQYRNTVTQISKGSGGAGGASGLDKTVVSGLPFTGLDLIALVGVAVVLASMGFALRRLTLDRDSNS